LFLKIQSHHRSRKKSETEDHDSLSTKFSLFPTLTEANPMSAMWENLSTCITNFSNKTDFASQTEESIKEQIIISEYKNSTQEGYVETVNQSIKSNDPPPAGKQLGCFEATFKKLGSDITILPSI